MSENESNEVIEETEVDNTEVEEVEEGSEVEESDDDAAAADEGKLPSGTMVMCDDGVERPVITREEAILAGSNRYFTGIECANGHMVERKVKGYVCTTCARNRQKARKKVRAQEDSGFKAKMASKRAEKHKARYKDDPAYRQKVLDRAKARRARVAAEKKSKLAQAKEEVINQ